MKKTVNCVPIINPKTTAKICILFSLCQCAADHCQNQQKGLLCVLTSLDLWYVGNQSTHFDSPTLGKLTQEVSSLRFMLQTFCDRLRVVSLVVGGMLNEKFVNWFEKRNRILDFKLVVSEVKAWVLSQTTPYHTIP